MKNWKSKFPNQIMWCRYFDSILFTDEIVNRFPFKCQHYNKGKCNWDKEKCDAVVYIPVLKKKELYQLHQEQKFNKKMEL